MSNISDTGTNKNDTDNLKDYKDALSNFLTGIVIITCIDNDGKPFGITINSFNSVSLNPKIICWSLGNHNPYKNSFLSQNYLIQILNSSQKDIAKQFSKTSLSKDFNQENFITHNKLPLLKGCLAWFECSLYQSHNIGDHILLLSEVLNFSIHTKSQNSSSQSLAFFKRDIFGIDKN